MTISSTSGSEPSPSSAFDALHPRMQRWIYDEGWTSLHDAQERAIGPILDGGRDVIIASATATGKTEAAFLPILSNLASGDRKEVGQPDPRSAFDPWNEPAATRSPGVQVLYLSPLKALINDQHRRLGELCERVDIPVHCWHGDVAAEAKRKLVARPSGVLLITPESLEAIFVNRGPRVPGLFAGLRYIVIDELHSFLTTQRGVQVQSLMNRVDLAVRRSAPRIGLSATLGDITRAAALLRPSAPDRVDVVESKQDGRGLMLQLRGYGRAPEPEAPGGNGPARRPSSERDGTRHGARSEISGHIFRHLRGQDNLVFTNARNDVEVYADLLARRSEAARVPNEFWPHHGNLSRELREAVEAQLKDPSGPATAVSTSTLELGIDIGSVSSVAQIGTPPSVASLWQRLGRSGRRDDPAVLRLYISERPLDTPNLLVGDALRCGIVQTTAMVRLMLDRWLETPDDPGFNYSTLIQQIMSVIAQHGGATAADMYRGLCGPGPFQLVDRPRFARLLRAMASQDLLIQTSDGLLLHGAAGERHVNHYHFYAAFQTATEWRVMAGGQTLGTIPIYQPLREGVSVIFAGKRWKVVRVDRSERVVELERSGDGAPYFSGGDSAGVSDRVREEMATVYRSSDVPSWLDRQARQLLAEGRTVFERLGLRRTMVVPFPSGVVLFPWIGDRALHTAAIALTDRGIAASVEGPAIRVSGTGVRELTATILDLVYESAPLAAELAGAIKNQEIDKWDWVLDGALADESAGARLLDIEGAWAFFSRAAVDLAAAPDV